jgi:hypothetical protein
MKTWKPTLEVLEGRAMMSGLWDPGPGGGTPVPTGPLGVPILAGKGGTGDISFQTPGGAVQVGNEVVFLTQDHWERGGFEDLEQDPPEGTDLVDLTPDDTPEPPGGGGGGGGGGILGWLGNLFGGGKDKESTDSGQGLPAVDFTASENSVELFVPPEVDVPGPKPESEWNTQVRPLSQPQSLSDLVSQAATSDKSGITLTPGGTSSLFSAKSSNLVAPSAWDTNWQPVTNVFQAQPGRATGGDSGSAISIEFTDAGVVDPTSRDTVYVTAPRDAETPVAVSVPDGGTVLLGGVKRAGQDRHETVDNDETITVHGVVVDALMSHPDGRGGLKTAHHWASNVDALFSSTYAGQPQAPKTLFGDASVKGIQAQSQMASWPL